MVTERTWSTGRLVSAGPILIFSLPSARRRISPSAALFVALDDHILAESENAVAKTAAKAPTKAWTHLHSFGICFNHIGPANQQFRRPFNDQHPSQEPACS